MDQIGIDLIEWIVISPTEGRSTCGKEAVGSHVDGHTFNRYAIQNEGGTVIEVGVQYARSFYNGVSLGIRSVGLPEDVILEPHA